MIKFDVIIPTYNSEKTIEACLGSIIGNKDYVNKIIIIDDNSEDDTYNKVMQFNGFFNIQWVTKEEHMYKGPGPSRRMGILKSASDWITFMDSDDAMPPDILRNVSNICEEYSEMVLIHTQSIYFENGIFVRDNIAYSDESMSGNFYKREYLLTNNILPHEILFMAEDQYFSRLLKHNMIFNNDLDKELWYENIGAGIVHRGEGSLALSGWEDYIGVYNVLSPMYLVDELLKKFPEQIEEIRNMAIDYLIWNIYCIQSLVTDGDIEYDYSKGKNIIRKVYEHYKITLGITESDVVTKDKLIKESSLEGVRESVGQPDFEPFESVEKFLGKEDICG